MAAVEAEKTFSAPGLRDFARQGAVYDGLMKTLREGTFVHAYLISGMAGVGKRSQARALSQFLLCKEENKPCGVCAGCVQVMEGTHPDLTVVQPGVPINPEVDKGLKSIPVDEIRMVGELTARHTYEGG